MAASWAATRKQRRWRSPCQPVSSKDLAGCLKYGVVVSVFLYDVVHDLFVFQRNHMNMVFGFMYHRMVYLFYLVPLCVSSQVLGHPEV